MHFDQKQTLTPFCVYTHGDYPAQPPKSDIARWIKQILRDPTPLDPS